MTYDPKTNYWSGTPGIWGPNKLVTEPNDPYDEWKVIPGNVATPWPVDTTGAETTAALDAVLIAAGLPPTGLTAPTALQLNQYADSKLLGLLMAERLYSGASVAGVTMPTGVTGITCAGGAAAANLLSINAWGQAAPAAMQQWTDDLYDVFTLTGAQAVMFSDAVLAYGQSLYAMRATAALAVKAGTITATAQIDALPWPV